MSSQIDQLLENIRRNFETLKDRWQKTMTQIEGNRLAAQSLAKLKAIPGPPHHPILWSSERQRKAYFASGGFGRGIPSTRTGEIVGAWQGEFVANSEGGTLTLINRNPAVQFLQGARMQGFHVDTGWVPLDDVTTSAHKEMGDIAVATFYEVGDPFQGV